MYSLDQHGTEAKKRRNARDHDSGEQPAREGFFRGGLFFGHVSSRGYARRNLGKSALARRRMVCGIDRPNV